MQNVRRQGGGKMLLVGASVVLAALTGCRDIEDRIVTGSIKDSIVVREERAPSPKRVAATASPAAAKHASHGKATAVGVAAASPTQMAAAQPVAKPPAAPAKPAADNRGPVQIALDESRALMSSGDVAGARGRLESAMTKARSPYLMVLAHTYDPRYLAKIKKANAKPDAAKAAALYREAGQLGSVDAERELAALEKAK